MLHTRLRIAHEFTGTSLNVIELTQNRHFMIAYKFNIKRQTALSKPMTNF